MPRIAGIDKSGLQIGQIADIGSAGASIGTLLCDGSSYAVTTYPYLWNQIGYTYGGSGANFNVPDIRGRVGIGAGQGAGLTNRVLATSLGEENHLLIVAEMPGHTHTDSGHTHTDAGHVHAVTTYNNAFGSLVGSGTGSALNQENTLSGTANIQTSYANLDSTGGGGSHNNIQPSLVVTKVIAYI